MLPCRFPVKMYPPVSGEGRWCYAPVGAAIGSAPVERPCGSCIPCRLNRKAEWSLRMQLEARCHEFAYFATLTYADEFLPEGKSLWKPHVPQFLNRFRARLRDRVRGARVRFSGCGEYGTQGLRPHYHLMLFLGETELGDLSPWRRSESGELMYRSTLLEQSWGMGQCELGSVTPQSCDYVAGYVVKKLGGDRQAEFLRRIDEATGESFSVSPEFACHSRMPGIGALWFQKWHGDVVAADGKAEIVLRGGERRSMPDYFLRLLKRNSERVAAGKPPIEGLEGLEDLDAVIAGARSRAAGERTLRELRDVGGDRELLAAMHAKDRERVAAYREYLLSGKKETL